MLYLGWQAHTVLAALCASPEELAKTQEKLALTEAGEASAKTALSSSEATATAATARVAELTEQARSQREELAEAEHKVEELAKALEDQVSPQCWL